MLNLFRQLEEGRQYLYSKSVSILESIMFQTVQKTLAAFAFNHIAYYYFDNVNVSQLKVALEKGEVELENLPIKKDALQHFNLPMEVVSGVVGNLSIKVPLFAMLTDSWTIKIKDLMIIVAPKKHSTDNASYSSTDGSFSSNKGESSFVDTGQDGIEPPSGDYAESSLHLEDSVNSELAESSAFVRAVVSAMVRDVYKNIKLEVESMTVLFQDFDHGLVKFSLDSLLLHRPKSVRNLIMTNVSIYLSSPVPSMSEGEELIMINFEKCNLDIHDEASNEMQLVAVQQNSSIPPATTSETKIEGNIEELKIEQLTRIGKNGNGGGHNHPAQSNPRYGGGDRTKEGTLLSKRDILKCDTLRIDYKLNHNMEDDVARLTEKNLHIKLDLLGMQYLHSQRIYDITTQRLMNLLKFFIKLQAKKPKAVRKRPDDENEPIKKIEETILNKLLVINVEEGLLFVVDDMSGPCAIPLLEFSLDDCRILQFSGKHQQNGFVFAKIGCSYFNREVSTWDTLLKPWPFNLSWDFKSTSLTDGSIGRSKHRQISLGSDEQAEFFLSSAFLDLGDVALKRIIDQFLCQRLWPLATSLCAQSEPLSQDFNSVFVLHNETGHRLQFFALEQNSDLDICEPSCESSPTMNLSGGDNNINSQQSPQNKLSINAHKSGNNSRDSPDLTRLGSWNYVNVGETMSFEYESKPIYRRHISDLTAQSRELLVRVEGWKTLPPISLDQTGVFYLEACSDRVMNEDTYIIISIDLEENSARKIISIRSPLNLVNQLDTTLEVHFVESNHALYIKPDSHLAVPLPYIFNRIHVRPCNVGVTMSEQTLLWDDIQQVYDCESKIHICNPITVTNQKHASYCTSQPYRICVSTTRVRLQVEDYNMSDLIPYNPIPVFSMSFIPPLTIVNLLPCKLQYFINDITGTLSTGAQKRIYQVDTTKSTDITFKMNNFPRSKPINLDPGATGSFHHTLEMFDKKNRILYLDAEIMMASSGEEPAVQVILSAPFWFINKTRLPLVFKQEGAALEAAGQFYENEEAPVSPLMFSFYDLELEQPYLCSMRLGESKGFSMWCEGFKLEKGSGERRVCFTPRIQDDSDIKKNRSLIDINIRRGFGCYSSTLIVTLTARYGFDPMTKTPKKATVDSPHSYKLTSYNHNVNLAERIAGQAVSLFDNHHHHRSTMDLNLDVPGFNLTLIDNSRKKLIEASVKNISVKCTTKAKEQILDCSIQDIRVDNLMPDCEKVIVLDKAFDMDESINVKPAIRLIMDRMLGNSFGTTLFRQVQLTMCELVLNIEEKLVLKLVEFISFRNHREKKGTNSMTHDLDKILHPEEDRLSKYYFDLLRIDISSLKLSVFTSAYLTSSMQKLKSYLGLKFFGFEDAQVQLSPYFKLNVSRTFKGVFESVTRFYKRQIFEQAPRIVGQQIQNYLRFHLSDLLSTLYDEVYNKLFN